MIALLCVTGCAQREGDVQKTQLLALGTMVQISVWGAEETRYAQAVKAVEETLATVDRDWHAWRPGPLVDLNTQLQAGKTVTIEADRLALLQEAAALARQNGDLFNPAIGRLIGLWGFHSDDRPPGPPPTPEQIAGLWKTAPTMSDLIIGERGLASRNPMLQLDLGAFAKGYAVDQAIQALRRLGIDHAIVNAGGDLRAIGRHDTRPWRIGVRHPTQAGVIASLETRGDESVFTSGNYERYFEYNGRRYHHIIDPRSGYPATGVLSVTVVSPSATRADAAATALFVAGADHWREAARRMGIGYAMLIDENLTIHMTPAMAERIRIEVSPSPTVVIEDAS